MFGLIIKKILGRKIARLGFSVFLLWQKEIRIQQKEMNNDSAVMFV